MDPRWGEPLSLRTHTTASHLTHAFLCCKYLFLEHIFEYCPSYDTREIQTSQTIKSNYGPSRYPNLDGCKVFKQVTIFQSIANQWELFKMDCSKLFRMDCPSANLANCAKQYSIHLLPSSLLANLQSSSDQIRYRNIALRLVLVCQFGIKNGESAAARCSLNADLACLVATRQPWACWWNRGEGNVIRPLTL